MNNKYRIVAKHPLIRPGLIIETEASEKYVVAVMSKLMELIRETNNSAVEKNVALREEKDGHGNSP